VLAVLVISGLVATSFATRAVAEQTLANRIKKSTGAESVSASVESPAFLYDVLVPATIQGVHIVATGVPEGLLRLDQVTVNASQIHLDRHQLVADQKVHIVAIGDATITALIKPEGLASVVVSGAGLLGVHVVLAHGHDLAVEVLGHQVYSVDLASNPLLPDCAFSLQQTSAGYSLSCHVAPVPQSMLDVISRHGG
jgi:hypothetical protein